MPWSMKISSPKKCNISKRNLKPKAVDICYKSQVFEALNYL